MTPEEWQQARLLDRTNPIDPDASIYSDYRRHRRLYCEACLLLWGVHCRDNLQVHHGITQFILGSYHLPELVDDPRICFTLCDSGKCMHLLLGHGMDYHNCNARLASQLKSLWELRHSGELEKLLALQAIKRGESADE